VGARRKRMELLFMRRRTATIQLQQHAHKPMPAGVCKSVAHPQVHIHLTTPGQREQFTHYANVTTPACPSKGSFASGMHVNLSLSAERQ